MSKAKIIILLMLMASVSSAFATFRPTANSNTRQEKSAQLKAKAISCPFAFTSKGNHYERPRSESKKLVASYLGKALPRTAGPKIQKSLTVQ